MCTDLPEDAPGRGELEQIHHAGVRAADLTRQLLAFSRRQVMETRVLDLNAVVRDVQRMLGRVLGEDIELRLVAAPDLGRVRADPGQLEQVVMNLVVNARDAMPTGGSLTIATANVELDDSGEPDHIGLPAGHYVQLSVTDTGMGMDKATQARIFEPFFTTKDVGKGTGLGLSTVFGIVKQSGGHIWVYSEPGAGATFKIFLPRAEGDLVAARAQAPAVGPGTETILVVDDDDQIRAIVAGILRRSGYQVLEAGGAKDALAMSERHAAEIHLLLCDVVMPEMNGRMLGEHIARARPAIKQLYMSGYTDDALLHHGVLDAGLAFLQKPITPAALCRRVRAVLDGDSERRPPR